MKHRSGAAQTWRGALAAIALLSGLPAGCNSRPRHRPAFDDAPPPIAVARPTWRYMLDERQGLLGLAVADGVVALEPARPPSLRRALATLVVLDARSGRERFRRGGFGGALALGGGRIFASDAHGGIAALRVRDGAALWRGTPRCPPPRGPADELVSNIYFVAGDLFVLCPHSTLVRLDAATGRKLATSAPLSVDDVASIDSVLPGVLAVTGLSATNARQYAALLRGSDLHAIRQFSDARFAGFTGHSAIVVPGCCFAVGGPLSLLRVDVRSGSQESVALRLDSAYPRARLQ